jgi:ketosteroid isomerase-like protein
LPALVERAAMSQKNVEIVRRGYELYEAGDLEDGAELFSDDADRTPVD